MHSPTLENMPPRPYKLVKDLTGLTGADMDLFTANDFMMMSSQLLSAEACEYVEARLKYFSRVRELDGDRPVSTNGAASTGMPPPFRSGRLL
jgi:hypothetical protein